MTGTGFFDLLERGRRLVRLPAGVATVVALMICPPVAVSSAHGRTPASGRSRSAAEPVLKVLAGDGIGRAVFSDGPVAVVDRLDPMLGRPPSENYRADSRGGGVDHEIDWPLLAVYFDRGRFVGYEYGWRTQVSNEPVLTTARGLRVGDTVGVAERLYGRGFKISTAQGGVVAREDPARPTRWLYLGCNEPEGQDPDD